MKVDLEKEGRGKSGMDQDREEVGEGEKKLEARMKGLGFRVQRKGSWRRG